MRGSALPKKSKTRSLTAECRGSCPQASNGWRQWGGALGAACLRTANENRRHAALHQIDCLNHWWACCAGITAQTGDVSDNRCTARVSRRREWACIIITEKRAVFIGMCVYICIDMYVNKRMNDQRKSTRLASFARIDYLLSSLGHRAKSLWHRGAAAQASHPFRGV